MVHHLTNSQFYIWRRWKPYRSPSSFLLDYITRTLLITNEHPRVITYINNKLVNLYFSLQKNIFNHWDINLVFFFNYDILYFLLNIYLDDQQNTLKYLKDTKVNFNNVLIMTRDFNIRDSNWSLLYLYHSIHTTYFMKLLTVLI